jgi:hypothetical protein
MAICSECHKRVDPNDLAHPCLAAAMALPKRELLERLYKSGGCTRAYYEAELGKL